MKWFKHDTGAIKDEKIQALIESEGIIGYALFFIVCELCAEKIKAEQINPKVAISWRYIELLTRTRRLTIGRVLDTCQSLGLLIKHEHPDEMIVEIPKLLKRLDNWTNRSVVATEELPSDFPTNKNKKKNKNKKENKSVEYPSDFLRFWDNYPKKVAKPVAFRAWNHIAPNEQTQGEILAGLGRAKTSEQWAKDEGRYIPNPATFLNQRRWEDEWKQSNQSTDQILREVFK